MMVRGFPVALVVGLLSAQANLLFSDSGQYITTVQPGQTNWFLSSSIYISVHSAMNGMEEIKDTQQMQ